MADKIALKRLGSSDLSFFEYHYAGRTYGASNQKGINLNTDVFVDQFYPAAHRLLGSSWQVLVTFFGPGELGAFSPEGDPWRPITYNNGKNWRLNGGTVHDDPRSRDRFSILAPGDLALLRFRGDPAPEEVDVILIAANVTADAAAHRALERLVPGGRRSMISLTPAQLDAALAGVPLPPGHTLSPDTSDPETEAEIDDVAHGGLPGPRLGRRRGRTLTRAELARSRELAEELGLDGEELMFRHLSELEESGAISGLDWTSMRDAAAPYDFSFTDVPTGSIVELDAKSTRGRFETAFHLSYAEAVRASESPNTYALARLYEIDEDGALLRITRDVRAFARGLLDGLDLPIGVAVDSFKIDPAGLHWDREVAIDRPSTDDGDEDEDD